MININTMDKLEKLHIGSDIDKLENYVAIINYSDIMGNCIVTPDKREVIEELLREVKRNSELFKYTWDMEKNTYDEFDYLYNKLGKFVGTKISDANDAEVKNFSNNIIDTKDIFAIALPDGIDLRILYRKGIYYKAYTYHKNSKGKDVTNHIKHLVPYNIQEITDSGLVELQSRITMTDDQLKLAGLTEADKLYFIVKFLSSEFCISELDKFTVKTYKMYCDDPESIMDTLWEEYELLENTELDLVDHALIRNIARDDVKDAINELQNYFDSLEDKEYLITDIILSLNDNMYESKITYSKKDKIKQIYKSIIQDIKWVCGENSQKPKIDIKPVMTKQGDVINNILLDNLNILIKLSLTKGSEVCFCINYIGQVEICNNKGDIIM